MKFRNVISGPIFCADAPDVVIETADAAGINVRLSISGFVWQFALSPVAEQSGYMATIKTRDILEALIEPSSIGSGGVSGVPVVEISAGADTESSISMSFQALYGSAAGKTPADMARHWLTWRDQISATYFGCRERLTFFAGLDLLGWKSGSYTVAVKIYTPSGIVQATLASGTIPAQVSYISVDASPASVLAVGEVSSLLAYDLSFSLSGTAADDTAATVESYPLRLVLGAADPRAKEFIYINSLGVEDRVTACGIRKDGLEGGSSKFVNGGVEREHGNEAQEQFEVYSGHLATARSVEQWMEFLKSSERHLYNAGLKGIVIDEYDTEAPEGELSSVSFTYRLSERIRGFHHDDSESIGDYDPKQKYGALIVGDIPDATTPAAEDLFFLKTRLDEFPLVSLSEDYLLLVQSPVSYHWGAASLASVKNWIQKTIDHNGISLAAVWASLSKTVPDTYANELISEDHIPTIPQSKVDGLAESLSALKTLIGGKADSSQLADYVLKSTYDTGMSGKLDKSVFDKLFTVHYKEGSATEIESLELNYGTWTTGFLSARGLDDTTGSGSGGTDLPAVWESLTKNEMPYQDVTINTAHIPVLPQSKVTGLPDALSSLRASYTDISALIPQAATADNQLADKEFVNSSIATATATFRGTFATLEALKATTADRNDYAFWEHKDADGNNCYDKYTYDGSAWKFEYRLNNSSFTAAQWGAINSGITGALVTRLSGISDWALAALKPSYTTAEVTEKTNLYFTDARAKSALSGHTGDTTIHITAAERKAWNAKWDWNEASIKAVKVNAAGSADKLANSRKLWGNAFNGTADVNGDITLGSGKRIYFGSTSYYIELSDDGNIHTNVGLYSDKFISARGSDPDAGGGSGASLPVVWASLQGNTDDYKDKTIHQAHIPTLPVSRIDGLATALAGKQPLITDLDTIRTNAATAFGWGDHSEAGYITLTNNTGQIYTNTVIDASALDANTWYPVLLKLSPLGPLFHIEVTNALDTNVPSWSTHQNGFTCKKVWEIYGSGWGAVPPSIIRRIIYESLYAYCDVDPVRGIGQLSNSSNDVVFVRGGGKYIFACSRGVVPTLITTSTVLSSQTIAPTTTAPAEIVRNNQLTTDSIAWNRLTGKPTTLAGYGIEDWVMKHTGSSPDTFKTAGNYKVETNGTSGNGYNFTYGQVLVLRATTDSNTIAQIAASYDNNNLYFRSGTVSNFTDANHPWQLIYNSGNSNNISAVWNAKRLVTPHNLICPYVFDSNTTVTGTLVLSLPYGFNSMMQSLELTVYDYSTTPGEGGATKFFINGYNFADGASSRWVIPTVFQIGILNANVRVGYYKNKCCILIGATNTIWHYPKLCVDKVHGTHSISVDRYGYNDWSCTFLQDESEISKIETAFNAPLYAPCYTRAGLPYVTDNDVSAKYLKLSGGTMAGDAAISWGVNDRTDWDTYVSGIRVMSSITANSGAPVQYATGISVMARYSFQIAAQGGDVDAFFIRAGNRDWKRLLHEGNYSSFALPLTGGTIKGSIRMDAPGTMPFIVRNYHLASGAGGGWARSIVECRVDDKNAFSISPFGNYTPGAANNKISYVSLGFAGYDGLNLRISETDIKWGNDAIYHTGNANKSDVDWACKSLTATGDISTAGWYKATNGLYGTNGVYFRQVGSIGEISIKNNNEFCWGSSDTILHFNFREATNGTTVKNYIWHAGSSTSYATHTMGSLTVLGVIHATTGIYTDGYISARKQDTSSDIRLKTDFRPLDGALEYIKGTHFTRFRWKDGSGESVGIIAQEEQSREYGFLVRSHGEIGHLTYDYAASTALLGAALQEEDEKVEALKRRVKELENELNKLKQSNYAR